MVHGCKFRCALCEGCCNYVRGEDCKRYLMLRMRSRMSVFGVFNFKPMHFTAKHMDTAGIVYSLDRDALFSLVGVYTSAYHTEWVHFSMSDIKNMVMLRDDQFELRMEERGFYGGRSRGIFIDMSDFSTSDIFAVKYIDIFSVYLTFFDLVRSMCIPVVVCPVKRDVYTLLYLEALMERRGWLLESGVGGYYMLCGNHSMLGGVLRGVDGFSGGRVEIPVGVSVCTLVSVVDVCEDFDSGCWMCEEGVLLEDLEAVWIRANMLVSRYVSGCSLGQLPESAYKYIDYVMTYKNVCLCVDGVGVKNLLYVGSSTESRNGVFRVCRFLPSRDRMTELLLFNDFGVLCGCDFATHKLGVINVANNKSVPPKVEVPAGVVQSVSQDGDKVSMGAYDMSDSGVVVEDELCGFDLYLWLSFVGKDKDKDYGRIFNVNTGYDCVSTMLKNPSCYKFYVPFVDRKCDLREILDNGYPGLPDKIYKSLKGGDVEDFKGLLRRNMQKGVASKDLTKEEYVIRSLDYYLSLKESDRKMLLEFNYVSYYNTTIKK